MAVRYPVARTWLACNLSAPDVIADPPARFEPTRLR